MKLNSFFKTLLLGITVVLFASCDKDFNEVGTNIIGEDHYDFDVDSTKAVIAYNQPLGAVQTNNLPTNALGYYNHPVFGKTKASFVTQVELIAANPKFINPATVDIDSVYLYVPYFIDAKKTVKNTETGDSTYELDSIYGVNPIKLEIFESKYYLRDFDASTGLEQAQRYYSSQKQLFENNYNTVQGRLNDSTAQIQNDKFEFKPNEIKLQYYDSEKEETVVKQRLAPGIFVKLNKEFFRQKIVNAPEGKLLNNNTFKDYFRGLYFRVDNSDTSVQQGSLALLNFRAGKIVMSYHDETSATNDAKIRRELTINLGGNTVNLFDSEGTATSSSYIAAMTNNTPDTPTGDEKLYLKGQNGAMAVIELFGEDSNDDDDDIPEELETIKNEGWLINDASLTFYIERTAMINSTYEPLRIYLYDLENNAPILDYIFDGTESNSNPKLNRVVHGGIIEKEDVDNGRGTQYKIRLTRYLMSLLADENASKNVKLGLVVTESIAAITNAELQTPITDYNNIKFSPLASVINPLGTVLYGSSLNVPENKRLKLKIYYTKPN
ncbi:DUF4270 domain-containing protein [Flavobacterium aquatile]|uniref:DUF4270 domain-containing protein n=1 Tax=Flavobacterium aquatile LMG 4008 = ATCC 11947 TaxID=1453498 RepID=A0A095V273_9FLAO|nr:DUF4270 domain-containing protein [Flavobacterium aquatile]KGD68960.1 hypothetical protein LG45_04790 [Flavobacterium aquatile LMG 4008 = ATCC 11947]OXA65671.1 hypothetical protein B0A61_13545 [Flavobacterium aquatile LMG 4008 = ATCC 11947]GEC79609.1 hypothetical protein FAQ01_24790 [Flavobacterium aquatile]